MATKPIQFNPAQLVGVVLAPKKTVNLWGRATGKTNDIGWKVNRIAKTMPRSSSIITARAYTHLLQNTLQPVFSFLERLGYQRNVNYFVGEAPPKSWRKLPYESPAKDFSKYITIGTKQGAVGFHLASQDREGTARGLNTDFEIVDEGLLIKKDLYDKDVSATNRGNEDRMFPSSIHHGSHICSSMPYTAEGKWLLDEGKYYETEAGIRIFDIWNRVCRMQVELLDITNPDEFKKYWKEIARVKQQMNPFVSKDGVLFTLANAFDNIHNVKLSYIREQRRKLPPLIFAIEIMNMVIDKVEDCYYLLEATKHIYYDSYNYSHIDSLHYDFGKLGSPDSRFDADVDPYEPLKIVCDLGANISFMLVCQENELVEEQKTFNFVKEFFVKPEEGQIMINDLVDSFSEYYRYHGIKTIFLYKDKYGDEGRANSSKTYNDQLISCLHKAGWNVSVVNYPGKEPPHHEKYLMWTNILRENNKDLPVVRFNGNNCKYLIISMNNTKVRERDNRFEKDKSSERKNSGIPQEEATHSTDAADKIIYVDVNYVRKGRGDTFIPFTM